MRLAVLLIILCALMPAGALAAGSRSDPRLFARIGSPQQQVRAQTGNVALANDNGALDLSDVQRPLPVKPRLATHPREHLRLRFRAPVEALTVNYRNAADRRISGRYRATGAHKKWSWRMKARRGRPIDRLALTTVFSDGSIVEFQVRLGFIPRD